MLEEPIYSTSTERLYRRIPEFYRVLDAKNDWHFKKYISAVGDQLDDIDLLVARLEYINPEDRANYSASLDEYNSYLRRESTTYYAGLSEYITYADLAAANTDYYSLTQLPPISETSDLLDSRTADPEWLDYIAQLTGANISGLTNVQDRRIALQYNYLGFRAGSKESIENAVKNVLTGTKFVRIYPQRNGAGGSVTSVGTQWDILIVTRVQETPSQQEVIDEIVRKGAKPAGTVLYCISYSIDWNSISSLLPVWSNIEQAGSWNNLGLA